MSEKPTRNKLVIVTLIFAVFYLATVVPVGLFIYSLKSDYGINTFKKGGYHTYLRCLAVSVELADMPEKPKREKKKKAVSDTLVVSPTVVSGTQMAPAR